MAKKFLLYINDDSIKVYHASKKSINFYGKYDIEDSTSIAGLLGLLNKYDWGIYVFLDSSEVMSEKKIFDRSQLKHVGAIVKNHSRRSDLLISAVLSNDYIETRNTRSNTREYAVFGIGRDTYPNLKNLIDTIANNKGRVHVINFMPICLGVSGIMKKDATTVNLIVRYRANRSYTIDVFYGHSFVVHRDDTMVPKTTISQEIIQTISYIETFISASNISVVTTIFTEVAISREELSAIRSDEINLIQSNEVATRYRSRMVIGKGSDSELDDCFLALVMSGRKYHPSFSNKTLTQKALLFRALPIAHIFVGAVLLGLLISEASKIAVKMPSILNKSDQVEKELILAQQELERLKKIAIDKVNLSFVESCSRLQKVDSEKVNYVEVARRLDKISTTYQKNVVFTKYTLFCSDLCHLGAQAKYAIGLVGTVFNDSGAYEDMIKLSKNLHKELQTSFSGAQVSLPIESINPEFGRSYKSFDFDINISYNNAPQKR